MAKALLKVGAEVDFLTEAEFSKRMDALESFQRDLEAIREGQIIVRDGHFLTDSTGGTSTLPNGGGAIYRVPLGFDAFLTRASFDFEGSSAASPTTCDLRIVADVNTPANLRAIFNSVPSVYEASRSHAALFRAGQMILISMTAGPHSTEMITTVQVVLVRRRPTGDDTLTDT